MKKLIFLIIIFNCILFTSAAQTATGSFWQEGIASWYGEEFDGRPTASGELFNSTLFTAAHPSLPFGTILLVTNRQNNRSVTVRVNDRGPFVPARIIDVSRAAAEVLDMIGTGTAFVTIEQVANMGPSSSSPFLGIIDTPPATPPQTSLPPVTTTPPPEVNLPPATPPPVVIYTPFTEPVPGIPPFEGGNSQSSIDANLIDPIPPTWQQTPPPPPPVQEFFPAPPARLIGTSPVVGSGRLYRLQVGSFSVARNAVDTFERLRDAGLSPNYERHENFYRVVLANVRPEDIPALAQVLGNLGIREVMVREEAR